ncbi:hypothetical protein [Hyphobacterium sp.]|uniref:hypothetical protein n=1 Tax=Hyphobacterium sp. TaxID=2004662 RepID=UPI003BABFB09
MILARLSKAIREQNWFAVVLEFFVVVSGVVIGFAITGWAENRAETARAELYLDRLAADLETNETRFLEARDFRASVRALGEEALRYASGQEMPPSDWHVIVAYFNASQAGGAEPVDATYREMVATGDLRLLRDLELRGELSAYYSNTGFARILNELPAYRETVRGVIPMDIQTYIWETCYASEAGRYQRLIDCEPPATEAEILAELSIALMRDEALNRQLRFWVSNQYAALAIHESQVVTTEAVLAQLRASRGADQ